MRVHQLRGHVHMTSAKFSDPPPPPHLGLSIEVICTCPLILLAMQMHVHAFIFLAQLMVNKPSLVIRTKMDVLVHVNVHQRWQHDRKKWAVAPPWTQRRSKRQTRQKPTWRCSPWHMRVDIGNNTRNSPPILIGTGSLASGIRSNNKL